MTKTVSSLTLLSFLLLSACDVDEPPGGDPAGELSLEVRSFPAGSYWDKVHCEVGNLDHCYGHRAGTGAVWSQVYSQSYIDELVTLGWLATAKGWSTSSCDPGGVPTSTPEYSCYSWPSGDEICFGGDDGWWSVVVPECQDDGYNLNWFATGSCITGIYASGYDDAAGKANYPNRARGWIGDEQFELRPKCYLDQYGMVGMNPDSSTPAWPMLECWITGSGNTCLGYRDGETVQVVAPSEVDSKYPAGTWIPDGAPGCSVDPIWEDVDCYYLYGQPSNRVCLGLLDNVRVISADPCTGPWAGHVDFHGLWAVPDDPVNYYGYNDTPWKG